MYIILVNNDNTLSATEKTRIIQRSKLADTFLFLVPAIYNGVDMADCTVLLEYLKPVSKKYKTEILVKSEELYKEHLQYYLPLDTEFTQEAGKLELQLTFLKTEMSDTGAVSQFVRKTAPVHTVDIIPISAWSDIIPDEALTPIDQCLIKMAATLQAIQDTEDAMDKVMVDGLAFNSDTNELQLTAEGNAIGNVVVLNSSNPGEDDPDAPDDPDSPEEDVEETDNVVDF